MFRAQSHVTLNLIKIHLNKQTGVAFGLNILVLMGISKIYVNLSFLDILMGHLHWMHPEDCNDHWGGEPISPIRLKPLNH